MSINTHSICGSTSVLVVLVLGTIDGSNKGWLVDGTLVGVTVGSFGGIKEGLSVLDVAASCSDIQTPSINTLSFSRKYPIYSPFAATDLL